MYTFAKILGIVKNQNIFWKPEHLLFWFYLKFYQNNLLHKKKSRGESYNGGQRVTPDS